MPYCGVTSLSGVPCRMPKYRPFDRCYQHEMQYRQLVDSYSKAADQSQRKAPTVDCYHTTDLSRITHTDMLEIPIDLMEEYISCLEREMRCRREHKVKIEGGREYSFRCRFPTTNHDCFETESERHLVRLETLEIMLHNTRKICDQFKNRRAELWVRERETLLYGTSRSRSTTTA